jgi:hypothetical protein
MRSRHHEAQGHHDRSAHPNRRPPRLGTTQMDPIANPASTAACVLGHVWSSETTMLEPSASWWTGTLL